MTIYETDGSWLMGMTDEEKLHQFRKEIDANIQKVEYFMGLTEGEQDPTQAHLRKTGRELALVRTKLQEAKMWAGKCLEAINSPFPEELRDKAE